MPRGASVFTIIAGLPEEVGFWFVSVKLYCKRLCYARNGFRNVWRVVTSITARARILAWVTDAHHIHETRLHAIYNISSAPALCALAYTWHGYSREVWPAQKGYFYVTDTSQDKRPLCLPAASDSQWSNKRCLLNNAARKGRAFFRRRRQPSTVDSANASVVVGCRLFVLAADSCPTSPYPLTWSTAASE